MFLTTGVCVCVCRAALNSAGKAWANGIPIHLEIQLLFSCVIRFRIFRVPYACHVMADGFRMCVCSVCG